VIIGDTDGQEKLVELAWGAHCLPAVCGRLAITVSSYFDVGRLLAKTFGVERSTLGVFFCF
jgi:hypothetical protein